MLSIFASIITAVFYVIFSAGIPVIMEIHKKRVFESEGLASAGIILAIAISGIGNLSVFNISIRGILCVLIVLMLGWKRGAAVGAASGITIGLILGLIGIGTPATIATYGLGGLLAGIFSKYGKLGVVAGFTLGNILLTFYANGSTEVIISLKEIIVASVCLFLVPKKVDVILDGLFDYNKALPEVGNLSIDTSTIYRLNAVSEVVDNMARTAYDNVNTNEQSVTTDEVSIFIKTLNDNTCKRCVNYAKCWEANYHNMYETIFNSIEVLQNNGEIKKEDLKDAECENKELLIDGLNFCYQIYKVNQNWQQKMREKRVQVSKQLRGVSEAINKLASDISVGRSAELLEEGQVEELFALEIGLSSTKKNRSEMSGDTSTYTKLQDGKYLIGLSDGMGTGKEAKKNSRAVIELLGKLLNTGFEKDMAIELVNSVMLLKQEDDMYATLDVAIFDSVSGNTEFIKVSACPTFIKKGENIDVIKSLTLPVGTLDDIDIDLYDKNLEEDDLIVMVTDGILESRQDLEQKETWIIGLLKNINTNNPQRIADIILQEAVDNGFGVPVDDMTVIVSKVKSLIDAKN
jgi:stage II sporulation protein E